MGTCSWPVLELVRVAGSWAAKMVVPLPPPHTPGKPASSSTATPIMRTAQQSCRGVSTREEEMGVACVATQAGFTSPGAE